MKNKGLISWLGICLMLFSGMTFAQNSKKEPQLRTVSGLVTDKADNPIQNAVVFLKNLRTDIVLSHFTDDQGNYRFSGLDPNVDYEIHAEFDGQKSSTRTVSPLESRKEIVLNLKVDRKKG